jgi:DnaJ-class molecular chaperone
MSYYKCLGISETSSPDEIKKAFRKKSLIFHPDKQSGDVEQFKKINEAYQTLGDAQKRKIYDMQQKGGMFHGMPGGFSQHNMNDIMSMFFNNHFPGHNPAAVPQQHPHQQHPHQQQSNSHFKVFYNGTPIHQKPAPITENITITLEESYMGGIIPLEINRTIINNNVKTAERENLYVKFPRGIDNNEMIILKNKGNQTNGVSGDIKIIFTIKNDTIFIRQGVDLIYNKTITLKEALTGIEMNIHHINGKKYRVDTSNNFCVINNNSNTSLLNLGMTRESHTGKLTINFSVKFPENITPEVREKLKELL